MPEVLMILKELYRKHSHKKSGFHTRTGVKDEIRV